MIFGLFTSTVPARRHSSSAVFLCLITFMSWSCSVVAVELKPPERSIGYFIGDILVQRIVLNSQEGRIVGTDLESAQRIDEFLYRLPAMQPSEPSWYSHLLKRVHRIWGSVYEGRNSAGFVFDLRYQVINVPRVTKTISLPEMTIVTDTGVTVEVPAWHFNVGPLSQNQHSDHSATQQGAMLNSTNKSGKLQAIPDRSASDLIDANDKRKFKARLGALLLLSFATLLTWLTWWLLRQFRDKRVLPFARARYAIKRLPRSQRAADDASWRALHAAFNETAGKTIGAGTVEDLLQRAPWLRELVDEIDNFYLASAERFFQQSDSARVVNVESLATSLYQLEKRQAPPLLAAGSSEQNPDAVSHSASRSVAVDSKLSSD